jgi:hypothetical protein
MGTDRLTLNFAHDEGNLYGPTPLQGCVQMSGGLTTFFDGVSAVETGFLYPPRVINVTGPNIPAILESSAISGGGSIEGPPVGAPAGSVAEYQYRLVFEWIDTKGNRHMSAASDTVTAKITDIGSTDNQITLDIATLPFTMRGDANPLQLATVAVFRTLRDQPETFYRLTSVAFGANMIANERLTGIAQYNDQLSDAEVLALGYGTLYTDGGTLDADPAPASKFITTHGNRLFAISAWDDRAIHYTRSFVRGEAPAFSGYLKLRLDDSPDGAVALASLDDQLVVFTKSRIYRYAGEGPNDKGIGGAFAGPFNVTTDTGATSPVIAVFPGGVIFQGRGGFLYLLGRDFTVKLVSGPAEETLRIWDQVIRAEVDGARQWVVFLLARSADNEYLPESAGDTIVIEEVELSPANIFLVFDYKHNQWFTWRIMNDGTAPVDHVFFQGTHKFLSGSAVYEETPDSWFDPAGEYITSTIQTPWIRLGAIGGFERLYRVFLTGKRMGWHTLTLNHGIDFQASDVDGDAHEWDLGFGYGAFVPYVPFRLNAHIKGQKASAHRLTITDAWEDAEFDSSGRGFLLAGLSLEIGVKRGVGKVPATDKR